MPHTQRVHCLQLRLLLPVKVHCANHLCLGFILCHPGHAGRVQQFNVLSSRNHRAAAMCSGVLLHESVESTAVQLGLLLFQRHRDARPLRCWVGLCDSFVPNRLRQRNILSDGVHCWHHAVRAGIAMRHAGGSDSVHHHVLLPSGDHGPGAVRGGIRVPQPVHEDHVREWYILCHRGDSVRAMSHWPILHTGHAHQLLVQVLLPAGVDCPDPLRAGLAVPHALLPDSVRHHLLLRDGIDGSNHMQGGICLPQPLHADHVRKQYILCRGGDRLRAVSRWPILHTGHAHQLLVQVLLSAGVHGSDPLRAGLAMPHTRHPDTVRHHLLLPDGIDGANNMQRGIRLPQPLHADPLR